MGVVGTKPESEPVVVVAVSSGVAQRGVAGAGDARSVAARGQFDGDRCAAAGRLEDQPPVWYVEVDEDDLDTDDPGF